jgi:hypothetical protein
VRTSKPIATISFNTPSFLEQKLSELTKAGKLSFWAYIAHEPEDDEAGNKPHCHVYVEPSKMIQTDDLRSEFKEFDPNNSKPLGCISFRSSKFDDWYMYGLHDEKYLAAKGQSRRYHYRHDDFRTSDEDDLLFKARSIDLAALTPYADMQEAQRQGLTFSDYFMRGRIPIQQIAHFQRGWDMLIAAHTFRGDYVPHPDDAYPNAVIDTETGAVIEKVHPNFRKLSDDEELPF